jgi:hypothetical protein
VSGVRKRNGVAGLARVQHREVGGVVMRVDAVKCVIAIMQSCKQSCSGIVLPCCSVAVLQCCRIAVLRCHRAPCCGDAVSRYNKTN